MQTLHITEITIDGKEVYKQPYSAKRKKSHMAAQTIGSMFLGLIILSGVIYQIFCSLSQNIVLTELLPIISTI